MKHVTKTQFLIYTALVMLILFSCKKTSQGDDNNNNENNLAENNFSINDSKYAANSTTYFNLNNEIISCYQINPNGNGGFATKYCIHIFFSGKNLPTEGGTYDIVYFKNITTTNNDKKLSLTIYQNNDSYFSFDAKTYQNPAAGVTQKAVVTVVNGKVTIKFTNIKLFNTNPTPLTISGNISFQQM